MHGTLSIAIMHRITNIITVTINTENSADAPMIFRSKEPYMANVEQFVIIALGARAPGAAVTPRRYRPLALPTKERGDWLTWTAMLRRASVLGLLCRKFVNALEIVEMAL